MSTVIDFPKKQYTMTPPVWSLIPPHMHYSVQQYVEHGYLDDEFLEAIVTNDLRHAVIFADSINTNHLVGYVKFFHNYCPSECWGSVENVQKWIAGGGLNSVK